MSYFRFLLNHKAFQAVVILNLFLNALPEIFDFESPSVNIMQSAEVCGTPYLMSAPASSSKITCGWILMAGFTSKRDLNFLIPKAEMVPHPSSQSVVVIASETSFSNPTLHLQPARGPPAI